MFVRPPSLLFDLTCIVPGDGSACCNVGAVGISRTRALTSWDRSAAKFPLRQLPLRGGAQLQISPALFHPRRLSSPSRTRILSATLSSSALVSSCAYKAGIKNGPRFPQFSATSPRSADDTVDHNPNRHGSFHYHLFPTMPPSHTGQMFDRDSPAGHIGTKTLFQNN